MIRVEPALRGWCCADCTLRFEQGNGGRSFPSAVEMLGHLSLHAKIGETIPAEVIDRLAFATWTDENARWLALAAKHWTPRRVAPIRVRAWLRSPIYWDARDTIQLEGALQHVVVRLEAGAMPGEVFAACTREESARTTIPIPVADVEIGGHTIATASAAWPWPLSTEGTRQRNKRARLDVLGLDKAQLSGGAYKSLRIPTAVLHVPFVDFFVRGDEDLLRELLREVTGLGRDSARGLGTVDGWEISADPEDRSLVHRGRPMRPLPSVYDEGPYDRRALVRGSYEVREATLRAPYWRDWMRVPEVVVPVVPTADQTSWWADAMREEVETA